MTDHEDCGKKLFGVYLGRVISQLDELGLGRVQIQVGVIDSLDPMPMARVATLMAGIAHGAYFLPNIGDTVLVSFESGDPRCPIVIGSLWSADAPPPLYSPLPQVRALRSPLGNQLVFDELKGTTTIQGGVTPPAAVPAPALSVGVPYQTLELGPTGVQALSPVNVTLQSGTTSIQVTPLGITLRFGASEITLSAEGVNISGPTVTVRGAGNLSLSGANISLG
ncbi:MAG: phage baseplate assembly protein V [Planctomycetaceae bacterium]|jgi:phage baseplate assembly protein gpV